MPMTNRERIEAELKARQEAGKTNSPTAAERGVGGTPAPQRTMAPWDPKRGGVEGGAGSSPVGREVGEAPKWQAPALFREDPSVIAARQAEFDRQQAEKQRTRGRASTLLTGGQGVLSSANVGRASLLGY